MEYSQQRIYKSPQAQYIQGECKDFMFKYMQCLRINKHSNSQCRDESKDYLQCRMDRNLMTKESWEKLGYTTDSPKDTQS
ncbi:cytochrome c oxidase assembly protein COX19-like isoform X2 [Haliotis rubra]|uniref:cytochrome c oxidase assembly protein COX19-like isoform X2 n=1 Tax=Haliotis rubra TaxID=36100 RepID=UPI001EE58182|nr:cytochrome c oxidase assembly protein COX19-like isoform X2 [Haliotis rubra]